MNKKNVKEIIEFKWMIGSDSKDVYTAIIHVLYSDLSQGQIIFNCTLEAKVQNRTFIEKLADKGSLYLSILLRDAKRYDSGIQWENDRLLMTSEYSIEPLSLQLTSINLDWTNDQAVTGQDSHSTDISVFTSDTKDWYFKLIIGGSSYFTLNAKFPNLIKFFKHPQVLLGMMDMLEDEKRDGKQVIYVTNHRMERLIEIYNRGQQQ